MKIIKIFRKFGLSFIIIPMVGLFAGGKIGLELSPNEEKAQRATMVDLDIRIRNIASMLSLRDGAGLYSNFRKLERIDVERPNQFKKSYTSLYQKWEKNSLAKYMNNVKVFAASGRKYLSDKYNTESKIEWARVEKEFSKIMNECRNCHAAVGL
ncbi:MAG: hypothetical protein ABUK01_16800 [Leptospirales bacterium]